MITSGDKYHKFNMRNRSGFSKFVIGILVVVFILMIVLFVGNTYLIVKGVQVIEQSIEKNGLKSTIDQIWYGKDKTSSLPPLDKP